MYQKHENNVQIRQFRAVKHEMNHKTTLFYDQRGLLGNPRKRYKP